jgi:hypothetical protein
MGGSVGEWITPTEDESGGILHTFETWIRTLFYKHRIQRDGVEGELENDPALPKME